jgi:HEAT repeat protein
MFGWLKFWSRRRNHAGHEAEAVPAQPTPPAPAPVERCPDPPEHAALLRLLEDHSPEARGEAADSLVRVGAPIVAAVAERLNHEEAPVRRAAAAILGEIGPPAAPALSALVRATIDRDEGVRRVAAQALPRIDPAWPIAPGTRQALPALIEGLRSSPPWISREAAALLVRIGRPAVPALVELLADWEQDSHRLASLRILEQLGPSAGEAAPALAQILEGPDRDFRQVAAEVLARIGAAATPAVPALIRRLSDWSPGVRQLAARTLGAVGTPAAHAVPALLGLLSDWDEGVRQATVAALSGIGEPAVPFLAQVLEQRNLRRVGESAHFHEEVERLWQRLDAEGTPWVPETGWRDLVWFARDGLQDQLDAVHEAAATALGRIGSSAAPAAPALVRALSHESPAVRLAAARALGRIGPGAQGALPPLAALLINGEGSLQSAAIEALPAIDPEWTGITDSEGALPILVARLPENGPRAVEAAEALALIGAPATSALIQALASDDRVVRQAAATTLGRIGPAARYAVPALTAALKDPHDYVREAAAQALARMALKDEN